MVTEFLHFDEGKLVGEVVDELSSRAEELTEYFTRYAYVVSGWGRLVGYVEVQELLLSSRDEAIATVMSPSQFVRAIATLDELKSIFDVQNFIGIPVVDLHNRLLGVVRRSAVHEALTERSDRE